MSKSRDSIEDLRTIDADLAAKATTTEVALKAPLASPSFTGNVGIGTSSPAYLLDVVGDSSTQVLTRVDNTNQSTNTGSGIRFDSSVVGGTQTAQIYTHCPANNTVNLIFEQEINGSNGVVETMRIDSSGNVLVGDPAIIRASSQTGVSIEPVGRIYLSRGSGTGGYGHLSFINGNGAVGSVVTSGSGTSYNTSSDYRLKEADVPMTGATERVKALRPINFAWKVDGKRVDGFYAHELQAVVPEAATGTKDAMMDEEYEVTPAVLDVEGNETTPAVMGTRSVPDMQGIDQSKLVPLLTATIQDLIARIEVLETTAI